ncbi:MAG: lytic transglycosylase domain-containing protein [Pseudomonadota bacterium]
MLMRFAKIFIFFICSIIFAQSAIAASESEEHIKSAFIFAKAKNWSEAITHSRLANNAILQKYFIWEYLKDPESEASFEDITKFLEKNPDWPDKAALEKRAEVALMADNPSDEMLDEWFSKHPPQTSMVKLKRAKNPEELKNMIRIAWVNDNYDKKTEEKIIAKYHSIFRNIDHFKRIDRLLWENKIDEAKRLLKYVTSDHQRLFQARIYLSEDKTLAPIQVLRVPSHLKRDSGLVYERIKWRLRNNDKDGVRELLLNSPREVSYPEKWWGIRDRQIREAIGEDNLELAKKLLKNHGQKSGTSSYREAKWLMGWIDLEFNKSAVKAYKVFTELFEENETPSGKAKAAYWAGRAAEKLPKTDFSRWYGEASYYDTTFYGQLANWELKKNDKNLYSHAIKSARQATSEEKNNFKKRELVQLIYALSTANHEELTSKFINHLAQNAKTDAEAVLAAALGKEIKRIDFGVRAAKKILQNDVVALEQGWPVIKANTNTGIEKSLIFGLVRQESEFYSEAISSSGAVGLMQLLPSTAKETAKKADIRYSLDKLYEPEYNISLGSFYLNRLINKFDGSYVLAIASYNAGPGRVQKWLNSFGKPNKDVHEVVNWIEKIPFNETRNYVQHVLENIQVYRFLLADKNPTKTMIADDLVR